MHKELILREPLNPKIKSGLEKIAAMVKRTLGPGGLPIIIQRLGQDLRGEPLGPKITKDGVSVANECASVDEAEDLIIQTVKHICRKTNTVAGDGTTTAIVLGEAIVNEMLRVLDEDRTLNPQTVKLEVEREAAVVIGKLKEMAKPVKDLGVIRQVAAISANGDQEIGDILGRAFEAVGAEGVVTVDEGTTNRLTLEVVEGYQIGRGAEGQNKFFNSKDATRFEAENAALVIFDGDIYNYTDVVAVLQVIYGLDGVTGKPTKPVRPVVFMANEFSAEVINFLLIQKQQGGLNFVAVRGPHTTTVRSGYYDDIAVLTGGERLGNGARALSNFREDDIGEIGKVTVDKYKCMFYDCQGEEKAILKRVSQLKALRQQAESAYDSQVISDRIGALTGGIAKIGVGGATEFEIKEKYDRIEDALNASRAAIAEGVVPGGGLALARIAAGMTGGTLGERVLSKALMSPFQQILDNLGVTLSSDEIARIMSDEKLVYDGKDKKTVDYMEAGIIDPAKVTRSALENAVSIASLLSTAGGGIYYTRDK